MLFKPDTVLKWHKELVCRKWTFNNKPNRGRPATSSELQELLLRLARENPSWGYGQSQASCTVNCSNWAILLDALRLEISSSASI